MYSELLYFVHEAQKSGLLMSLCIKGIPLQVLLPQIC